MKNCKICKLDKEQSEFVYQRRICKPCFVLEERKRDKSRVRDRTIYRATKERKRYEASYKLKSRYGIDMDTYNKMFLTQNGCCAICMRHQVDLKTRLAVDHNHITGEVRGLLCMICNTAIGKFSDNVDMLRKAIEYLENEKRNIQIKSEQV